MSKQDGLKQRIEATKWGYIPLLPIWLVFWTAVWPLTFLFLPDEATGWLLFFLGLGNLELLWHIIKQVWPDVWYQYWLLFVGVAITTVAVHILGVAWLAVLCPLVWDTAVYTFLETHELCYAGVAYDSTMLFGLMFGIVFLIVIFVLGSWETIKHWQQPASKI